MKKRPSWGAYSKEAIDIEKRVKKLQHVYLKLKKQSQDDRRRLHICYKIQKAKAKYELNRFNATIGKLLR